MFYEKRREKDEGDRLYGVESELSGRGESKRDGYQVVPMSQNVCPEVRL